MKKKKQVRVEAQVDVGAVVKRALYLQKQIEAVKPHYQELDKITYWLASNHVDLRDYPVEIVDNYTEKNTAWKSVAIRRFELKRVTR